MLENNLPTLKHIIKVLLISALIIFVLAFCGDNLRSTNNHRTSKDYKYISCYTYSQELVKQKLKSPKSADFPAALDHCRQHRIHHRRAYARRSENSQQSRWGIDQQSTLRLSSVSPGVLYEFDPSSRRKPSVRGRRAEALREEHPEARYDACKCS